MWYYEWITGSIRAQPTVSSLQGRQTGCRIRVELITHCVIRRMETTGVVLAKMIIQADLAVFDGVPAAHGRLKWIKAGFDPLLNLAFV